MFHSSIYHVILFQHLRRIASHSALQVLTQTADEDSMSFKMVALLCCESTHNELDH